MAQYIGRLGMAGQAGWTDRKNAAFLSLVSGSPREYCFIDSAYAEIHSFTASSNLCSSFFRDAPHAMNSPGSLETYETVALFMKLELYGCTRITRVQPEDIDPYTLFIGNLPNVVTVQTVKQMFPAAKRIDIGHAQRIKHTRYAFIRFTNVEEAIQAFKANHNKVIDGKNIIIRFRRHNAPIALPEDTTTPKTPKRQKAGGQQQQPQLVVSVEQRPKRLSLVPAAAGPGHSGTLSTIKTEILDEDDVPDGAPVGRNVKRYEGAGGPLCVIKSEPDDTDIEDSLEEEEDVDNIRD
uniref:RRM domain-containing protein n=1 Tax=Anopheles melas TaxID=34690 RepID=A0A182TUU1_9DIPT